MAKVLAPDQVRQTGFSAGVNNVFPEQDPARDQNGAITSLREAVNVDLIGPSKKVRGRPGYTQIDNHPAHSLFALRGRGMFLGVVNNSLNLYDRYATLLSTIRAIPNGTGPLTYAEINGDIYWCSATDFRRVRGTDFADTPGWIGSPGTPSAFPYSGGSLSAGTYRIAMTWFDAEGRESAATGLAEVDILAGQSIHVTNIPPAPEGAVFARVYVTPPGTEELYAFQQQSTSVTNFLISDISGLDGKALETAFMQVLPPCDILRLWSGRLIGFAGNLLLWSDPLRFGLMQSDNYMRFGQRGTLLEPVGDGASSGLWIADHKYTYWVDGDNPKNWRRVIKYDHPAVFGTSLIVKGTDVGLDDPTPCAVWMAANGVFMAGMPGGTLRPLTEGTLAADAGDMGASLFREFNGARQVVTSYIAGQPNQLHIGDRVIATVTPAVTPVN